MYKFVIYRENYNFNRDSNLYWLSLPPFVLNNCKHFNSSSLQNTVFTSASWRIINGFVFLILKEIKASKMYHLVPANIEKL